MNLQKAHEAFMKSKLQCRYSLNEAEDYLTTKYRAKLRDKKDFESLSSDPFVNFQNVVNCLTIEDEELINSLLSEDEKEERKHVQREILNNSELNEEEKQQILQDEMTVNILIESTDNKFISNFTIQGGSDRILNQLSILKGIDQQSCFLGNEDYENFLHALVNEGYIS